MVRPGLSTTDHHINHHHKPQQSRANQTNQTESDETRLGAVHESVDGLIKSNKTKQNKNRRQQVSTCLRAVHESVDGLVEEVLHARAHARHQVHGAAQRGERARDGQDLLWWGGRWMMVGGIHI